MLKTNPDKFWDFSKALFDKQTEFFDVNVVHEERNKTYERLSKIAGDAGVDSKKIYQLLEVSDKPDKDGGLNIGNGVTDDIKIMVKVRASHLLTETNSLMSKSDQSTAGCARDPYCYVQCMS